MEPKQECFSKETPKFLTFITIGFDENGLMVKKCGENTLQSFLHYCVRISDTLEMTKNVLENVCHSR